MLRFPLCRTVGLLGSLVLVVLVGPPLYAAPQRATIYRLTPADAISDALHRAQPGDTICDTNGQLSVLGASTINSDRACTPSGLSTITRQQLIGEPLPPLPTEPPTRTPRIPPTTTLLPGATKAPATATPVSTATPPSTTPRWHLPADAPLVIAASQGQLAPHVFTVRNEGGRAYLTTTGHGKLDQGEKQGARYDLVVDTAGRYVVWVLGRGHGDDANSVFVRAGATGSVAVHFDDDGWRWERVRSPITFAAGQTTLRLFPRERGTDVQTLLITRVLFTVLVTDVVATS